VPTDNNINQKSFSYENLFKIVNGYLDEEISENKMSNWIKEIYENGMSVQESADYTKAIINTGTKINFNSINDPIVDKHSTGGVGDKVSLILGPLLAAYGYYVPMIVGRSLGHTGGTLDKLCSIPGYQPYLSIEKFKSTVRDVGISIMGQTNDICPGDKKIYALRDRINMIDSYPLICGSIMSKKIAEGIQGLVLDIKTGNGAFMYEKDMAENLGTLLKKIGEFNNVSVKVAITDMNQPLGNYSGISCEILESIEALKGNGPDDLMELVFYLAIEAIEIFDKNANKKKLYKLIDGGYAYEKFEKMINAHGGCLDKFHSMDYQNSEFRYIVKSDCDGYINSFQTRKIGELLSMIGGGRLNNPDGIDNHAGLRVYKKISDYVSSGEPLIEFYCSSEKKINNLMDNCENLIKISKDRCDKPCLVY
tara:strand:+ start:120 stop:1385 length:1266 start_codon:yes stop_codon:yes gene_type:complete